MIDVKLIFNKIDGKDESMRIDPSIPLDIFLGRDEFARLLIFIISKNKPVKVTSSNLIEVEIGQREDKTWALSFILKDEQYADIFFHFCNDIIQYTLEYRQQDIATCVIDRYNKWHTMLKKNMSGLLSKEEIKGLIGEIHFLMNFLLASYSEEQAVYSWVGMDKNQHDFCIDNIWYEIKSVKNGAALVNISSIEQLDYHLKGKLIIKYFNSTSVSDMLKITLNSIVKDLLDNIKSNYLKIIIKDKLLEYGYIHRKEYDDIAFKYIRTECYNVDKDFPALRRSMLPESVKNVKYELLISHILRFLEEV